MARRFERSFITWIQAENQFQCDHDTVFDAAAEGAIPLWTFAGKWATVARKGGGSKARSGSRGYESGYVQLFPEDIAPMRTEGEIRIRRAMNRNGQTVVFKTAQLIRGGQFFVRVKDAETIFSKREEKLTAPVAVPSVTAAQPTPPKEQPELMEHLKVTIGALARFLADYANSKGTNKFISGSHPNASEISKHVRSHLDAKRHKLTCLSEETLKKRISEGSHALKQYLDKHKIE